MFCVLHTLLITFTSTEPWNQHAGMNFRPTINAVCLTGMLPGYQAGHQSLQWQKVQISSHLFYCDFPEWFLILAFQKQKIQFSIPDLSTLSATVYHQSVPVLRKRSVCSYSVSCMRSQLLWVHVYNKPVMSNNQLHRGGAHKATPLAKKLLAIEGFSGKNS